MNRYSFLIFTLIIAFCSCMTSESNLLSVKNFKCTINEQSTATQEKYAFFSWQINSEHRNQLQVAYQIVVAENSDDLKLLKNSIWDSGKINSDKSALVKADGLKLKSHQTYFWKVKVWNQDGKESAWSEPVRFKTGLFLESDWAGAKWIGYKDLPAEKRMVPGVHGNGDKLGDKCVDRPVVPLFRKEFEVSENPESATLFVSGLGQYEASINGEKVGDAFLTPGWTNYDKTVFYNSYDITSMLKVRKKCSWSNSRKRISTTSTARRYRKLVIAYGEPKLIAQLRIKYKDGTEKILVSGADWKVSKSPITFTSIYGGEDYDARLEQANWNQANFDDQSWQQADIGHPSPSGKLTEEKDYLLEIKDTFSAKTITKLSDGAYLYDFAQNASGIVEIKVQGKKGHEIRLTPSELVTKDGQPNQTATGSHLITFRTS